MSVRDFFEKELSFYYEKVKAHPDDDGLVCVEKYFPALRELFDKFDEAHHSGSTAYLEGGRLLSVIENILDYQTFLSIDNEEEFLFNKKCFGKNNVLQSKRIHGVFKTTVDDSRPYYLHAAIFRENIEGSDFQPCFGASNILGISSSQYVRYPFYPKTFYIDVKRYEKEDGSICYEIMYENQVDELKKYYDCENSKFFNYVRSNIEKE